MQELLGEIVTWDTRANELDVDAIRNALAAAGLPDEVARDLNNRSAFSRAARHLKENRSIDKVNEKGSLITFQLTKKQVVADKIDFVYEAQVTLDTLTGDILCDDPMIQAQAQSLFSHAMRVRGSSDVTRMVQGLFKKNADLFPINPSRGVAYFVPEAHREFSAKVEQFLKEVGGVLWRFPVPKGTPEGNKSVRDAVSSGLQAVLEELNACVEDWDETTREDTMQRGLERWNLLRHKAESYASYLESEQASLLSQLESAKSKLVEKALSIKPESDIAA